MATAPVAANPRQPWDLSVPSKPVIADEVDTFEALYREHAPRLYALASRISGSRAEGEDLLQEIFLQAHRKLDSFRGDAAVGTWLHRLAVNLCLDYVRSRQGKMSRMMTPLESDNGHGTSNGPLLTARTDKPVERLDLERAIEQLPEGCREAFVLHDVEGFGHKEIAAMLGIAEGTSKSQVFKARMKLRAMLR
jgi:RNA polymerase sigma-70 factor (ECF subfamily)